MGVDNLSSLVDKIGLLATLIIDLIEHLDCSLTYE